MGLGMPSTAGHMVCEQHITDGPSGFDAYVWASCETESLSPWCAEREDNTLVAW